MWSSAKLLEDLRRLGVEQGDTVLFRASLGSIGKMEGRKGEAIFKAMCDAVGEQGTIVTLGFSKVFPFYKVDKKRVFNSSAPANTGALSKLFLTNPNCLRSKHPSNSFLAIGANAEDIVAGHDENSMAYTPMKTLIELNAKMVLIGCVSSSPGFTTVHYAQQVLGLTNKSLLSGLFRVYYEKDGSDEVALFKKKDLGGCSMGFGKFYKDYIEAGILKTGNVGSAYSIAVEAKPAYEVEYNKIKENPRYPLCDNPLCFVCRATQLYNIQQAPGYICRKITAQVVKKG